MQFLTYDMTSRLVISVSDESPHLLFLFTYLSATNSSSPLLEKANLWCRDTYDHMKALLKSYLGNGGHPVGRKGRDDGERQSPLLDLLTPNFHFSESLAPSVTCFTQWGVVQLESNLSGWKLVQTRGKKTDSAKPRTHEKITLPQEVVKEVTLL